MIAAVVVSLAMSPWQVVPSHAGIIYFDMADVILTAHCVPSLDVDLDGADTDISFEITTVPDIAIPGVIIEYLRTSPSASPRVIGMSGTEFTIPHVVLLTNGFVVGSSLEAPLEWLAESDIYIHSGLYDFDNLIPCDEDFSGQTGFIGLEFDISGNTHYGWLRMTLHPDTGAAILRDYAYETTPGMGILAGQIPEPSTVLLLSLGGLGLLWRAQRKR